MNYKYNSAENTIPTTSFNIELCRRILLPRIIEAYITTIRFKYGQEPRKWPLLLRQEFEPCLSLIPPPAQEIGSLLRLNQRFFPWESKKYIHVPFGKVFSDEDTTYIILRGTTGPYEWFKNTQFILHSIDVKGTTIEVHKGFYELFLELKSALLPLVSPTNDKQLVIAGHSLGGAIAQLIGMELQEHHPLVYTFGAPRVGNQAYRNYFNRLPLKHFRVVNPGDFVPELPPVIDKLPTYFHTGELIEAVKGKKKEEGRLSKLQQMDWRKHMPAAYLKALGTPSK